MSNPALWLGRVEVLTPPTELGDTKAFTNVLTWAVDAENYELRVASVFGAYGWTLVGVEECAPLANYKDAGEFARDAAERAKGNAKACIYDTFHYYPSKVI